MESLFMESVTRLAERVKQLESVRGNTPPQLQQRIQSQSSHSQLQNQNEIDNLLPNRTSRIEPGGRIRSNNGINNNINLNNITKRF